MKHTLVASFAAMAIATSAFAQDNQPAVENTQPPLTAPETPGVAPLAPGAEGTAPNMEAPDAMPQTEAATPEATPSDRIDYMAQQQSGEWLASKLIGTKVESSGGDKLGDINDVIVGKSGDVIGAVIGVGGFLGLGEKNVAIPFENVSTTMKNDKEAVIVLNVTREELEAAPDFADLNGQPIRVSQGMQDTASETNQQAEDLVDGESDVRTQ
jgi:sporulation protein YlmC with PRC-barrel domain